NGYKITYAADSNAGTPSIDPTSQSYNIREVQNSWTYHSFLVAHLKGGTIRDLNFEITGKKHLYTWAGETSDYGFALGAIAGVVDEGSVIDNVSVTFATTARVILSVVSSTAKDSATCSLSSIVGGIVGVVNSTTNNTDVVKNCSVTMENGSIIAADGFEGDSNAATATGGIGYAGEVSVGGIIGAIWGGGGTLELTDNMLTGGSQTALYAGQGSVPTSGGTTELGNSNQAAAGLIGAIYSRSANASVTVDGFIFNYNGIVAVRDLRKPFSGATYGVLSAGFVVGRADSGAEMTFKGIYASKDITGVIKYVNVYTANSGRIPDNATASNYQYSSFANAGTEKATLNDATNFTTEYETNAGVWVGHCSSTTWKNSAYIQRPSVNIMTGGSAFTDQYTLKYTSIINGTVSFESTISTTNKYFSAFVTNNSTSLLYNTPIKTYTNTFDKNHSMTLYDMYYISASDKIKITPEAQSGSDSYSKVYDGSGVAIAYTLSETTNGWTPEEFMSASTTSIFKISEYYVNASAQLEGEKTLGTSLSYTTTYINANNSSEVSYLVRASVSAAGYSVLKYYNNTSIPTHGVWQTDNIDRKITIKQKGLTVNYDGTTNYTYNGTTITKAASVDTGVNNETLTVVLQNNVLTNAGEYKISATGLLDRTGLARNYMISTDPGQTVNVLPKGVEITFYDLTHTYDGNTKIATASVATGIGGQSLGVTLNNKERRDAGSQVVTVAALVDGTGSASNYKLPDTAPSATLTVNKKVLTPTFGGGVSPVYDGQEHTITATVDTDVSGETLTCQMEGMSAVNVGSYTAKVTALSGDSNYVGNYILTGTAVDLVKAWAITVRTLTVSPKSGLTKVYDASNIVLTNADFEYSNQVGSQIPGFDGALGVSSAQSANVGTYNITAGNLSLIDNEQSGFLKDNYTLTINITNFTYTVTPRPITIVKVTDATVTISKTYDGSTSSGASLTRGTHYKINGIDDETDTTVAQRIVAEITGVEINAVYNSKNVSEADKTVATFGALLTETGYISTNYTYTANLQLEYSGASINARSLTVTPYSNISKTYGETDPDFGRSFEYQNNVTGETPGFSGNLTRKTGENVGEYSILGTTLTLDNSGNFASSNYQMNFATGVKFIIEKKAITITPQTEYNNNKVATKIYGEVDTVIQFSNSGVASGETFSYAGALVREAGENVGDYDITIGSLQLSDDTSGAFKAANYTIDFVSGVKYTITQRELLVTPTNKTTTKVYGESDPDSAYVYTYSNTANSEVPGFTGGLSRETGQDVGSYKINGGNLTLADNSDGNFKAENYKIAFNFQYKQNADELFAYCALTITKKTLTANSLVTSPVTKTYDGTLTPETLSQGAHFSITGLEYNEAVVVTNFTATYNSVNVTQANEITLTFSTENFQFQNGAKANNYILPTTLIIDGNILVRTLTITPTAALSKTYGDTDPTLTYDYSNNVAGQTPAFSGVLSRAQGENAGTYSITFENLTLMDSSTLTSANYTLELTTSNFTINPKTLTITPKSDLEKIYDAKEISLSENDFTYSTTHNNETPAFSGSLGANSPYESGLTKNIGEYLIIKGDLALIDSDGFVAANYTLALAAGQYIYTITIRTLTLKDVPQQTREYDATNNFTLKGGTLDGIPADETDSISFSWPAITLGGSDAGEYNFNNNLQPTLKVNNTIVNYYIGLQSITVYVTARQVTFGMNVAKTDGEYRYLYDINSDITKEITRLHSGSLDQVLKDTVIHEIDSIKDQNDQTINSLADCQNIGSYKVKLTISTEYSTNYQISQDADEIVFYIDTLKVTSVVFDDNNTTIIYDAASHSLTSGSEMGDIYAYINGDSQSKYYPAFIITYVYAALDKNGAKDTAFDGLTTDEVNSVANPGKYTITLALNTPYFELADNYTPPSFTLIINYRTLKDGEAVYTGASESVVTTAFNYSDQKNIISIDQSKLPSDFTFELATTAFYLDEARTSVTNTVKDAKAYYLSTTISNIYYFDKEVLGSLVITPLPLIPTYSNNTQVVEMNEDGLIDRTIGLSFKHYSDAYATELANATYSFKIEYIKDSSVANTQTQASYANGTLALPGVGAVGVYEVELSIAGNYKFDESYKNGSFVITKRTLGASSIGINDSEVVYNRSAHGIDANSSDISAIENLYGSLGLSYEYSIYEGNEFTTEKYTDAGEYSVYLSATGNDYFYSGQRFASAKLTITKAVATLTRITDATQTYQHVAIVPEFTIKDVYENADMQYTFAYQTDEGSIESCINVGTYKITVLLTEAYSKNYKLATSEFNLEIIPMHLVISTTAAQYTYDQAGKAINYTVKSYTSGNSSYDDINYSDYVVAEYRESGAADAVPWTTSQYVFPGVYDVRIKIKDQNSNYIIEDTYVKTTLTIVKRTYDLAQMFFAGQDISSIKDSTITKTYTGSQHTMQLTFKASYSDEATKFGLTNILGQPIATYTLTSMTDNSPVVAIINAGSYTYSVTLSNPYYEEQVISVTLIISPIKVLITGTFTFEYNASQVDPNIGFTNEAGQALPPEFSVNLPLAYEYSKDQIEGYVATSSLLNSGYYRTLITSKNNNYVFESGETSIYQTIVIEKQVLAIQQINGSASIGFDGNEKTIEFVFKGGNETYQSNDNRINYTAEYYKVTSPDSSEVVSSCIEVGSYYLRVIITNEINYTGDVQLPFSITKHIFNPELTLIKTYTGVELQPGIKLQGITEDVINQVSITITKTSAGDSINVGTYTFNIKLEHANFTTYTLENISLVINPAIAKASLISNNAAYKPQTPFEPSVILETLGVYQSYYPELDTHYTVSYYQGSNQLTPYDAGDYQAVVTLVSANFTFEQSQSTLSLPFTITKAVLEVLASSNIKEKVYYDGAEKPFTRDQFTLYTQDFYDDFSAVGYQVEYFGSDNSEVKVPIEIGNYKIKVTVVDFNYAGVNVFDFSITPKQFGSISFKESLDQSSTYYIDYSGNPAGMHIAEEYIQDVEGNLVTSVIVEYRYVSSLNQQQVVAPTDAGTYYVTATVSAELFESAEVKANLVIK
ncbi:MAG: YDG domain-containing protein, partial [Christensenellaceae bacterium]|nr:YDG domain-containing protein [Christensenellaceae bacterium]